MSAQLRVNEEDLLDPVTRRDRRRVEALLDEGFREFGSSGRVWTRQQILDLLSSEDYLAHTIEDFNCEILTSDIAHVTYRVVSADRRAESLRSSLWKRTENTWRMRFHQGTRVA